MQHLTIVREAVHASKSAVLSVISNVSGAGPSAWLCMLLYHLCPECCAVCW